MYRWMAVAAVALSLAGTARAAIKEEPVTYKDGETTMKGFVVHDDAKKGKQPGIVLVQRWWGGVKAKVLVLNGADDPFVKKEQYQALEKDFDAAKADYKVIQYPGAVHAFTNPQATELGKKFNLPLRYDAKANKEAKAEADKLFAAA